MVAASPIPSILAAARSGARRRIANHFYVQHAISAEDAVAFVPQSPIEHRQFERMRARGVVREAAPGRYWLDRSAFEAEVEAQRRMLVPVVIVLCVIAAGLILLGYRG